jgi:hypothetical protein
MRCPLCGSEEGPKGGLHVMCGTIVRKGCYRTNAARSTMGSAAAGWVAANRRIGAGAFLIIKATKREIARSCSAADEQLKT